MDEEKETSLVESGKNELLDIFTKEEDKQGTDLLAMSDFFDVFIGKIEVEMGSHTSWEIYHNIEGFVGEIAAKWGCSLPTILTSARTLLTD